MFRFLKILIFSILGIVVFLILVIGRLLLIYANDYRLQKKNLKELNKIYETNYQAIDETRLVNFDINDESIRLNEIQILATHNSYKKQGSDLGRFLIGLGDSFSEARKLKYGNESLTYQYNQGIRSQEWDIRYQKQGFKLIHVPLVDNSSVAPDFKLALRELYLFSKNNPNHIPIIILVELKDDWMMLNPLLKDINKDELMLFDKILEEELKDNLFIPNDMLKDNKQLNQVINEDGWPSVSSLLGKIMFVLHPGFASETYYEIDQTLKTQKMFIGGYASDKDKPYASFIVNNDLNVDTIRALVNENLIVRTRIDADLVYNKENIQKAIDSHAQILSTDFSIGRKNINENDVIYLKKNYTVIRKESE